MNRARSRQEMEYELLDTGVFDEDRYFDVEVEHAKAGPEDILCRVTVHNRSAQEAALHVLPTLWFRNTWSWPDGSPGPGCARVEPATPAVRAEHHEGRHLLPLRRAGADLLFCENETNAARVWGAEPTTQFPKDGIGDYLLHGADTVNPDREGTKAAAHVRLAVPAGGQAAVLVRLTREDPQTLAAPFAGAEDLIAARRAEADEFYDAITPPAVSDDAKAVMRQALAGMLWSKQCYYFDVDRWLRERRAHPLRAPMRRGQPQRVVVPHVQPGRRVHAGQVGVPLVRRMGPGLPLHPAGHGRPGLRQEPDRPDAVPGVPAPERADARLRVELRRREPPGARLRHAVPAEPGSRTSARWTCPSCRSASPGCC